VDGKWVPGSQVAKLQESQHDSRHGSQFSASRQSQRSQVSQRNEQQTSSRNGSQHSPTTKQGSIDQEPESDEGESQVPVDGKLVPGSQASQHDSRQSQRSQMSQRDEKRLSSRNGSQHSATTKESSLTREGRAAMNGERDGESQVMADGKWVPRKGYEQGQGSEVLVDGKWVPHRVYQEQGRSNLDQGPESEEERVDGKFVPSSRVSQHDSRQGSQLSASRQSHRSQREEPPSSPKGSQLSRKSSSRARESNVQPSDMLMVEGPVKRITMPSNQQWLLLGNDGGRTIIERILPTMPKKFKADSKLSAGDVLISINALRVLDSGLADVESMWLQEADRCDELHLVFS